MIEIIVKMPSLSPTLKWLRVSLAPTGVGAVGGWSLFIFHTK